MPEVQGQPVDPMMLARLITYLDSRTDEDFAEALADCIMDPRPDEVAAFRSRELAPRSLISCQYLIDHANTTIAYRHELEESGEGEADKSMKWKQKATARFRDRVGRERRLLEKIVEGDAARTGRASNAPSARGRALRRLKQLHLPEYQALVREEQAKIDAENEGRRRRLEAERAAARAARPAGSGRVARNGQSKAYR